MKLEKGPELMKKKPEAYEKPCNSFYRLYFTLSLSESFEKLN